MGDAEVRGLRMSEKTTRCAVALDQGLRMQQAAYVLHWMCGRMNDANVHGAAATA